MTIEWRYRVEHGLGVLSVSGHLGPEAAHRFAGAVGWVVARGTGPVVVDLSELRGWSAEGRLAVVAAAGRLAACGRAMTLAAVPAGDALLPPGEGPAIPVHGDLPAALAAHAIRHGGEDEPHEWRTEGWTA
ncbi:anti-sigma factor antagonist [Streptomyces sp. SID5785]|nr:anti-sigma factor antagonist [Streptomyces sp. SID5785]MZD03779.1 anti-sigma factor antagonist [Streptomyces sp. SID5785]